MVAYASSISWSSVEYVAIFPSVDKALVVAIFPSVDKALVVAIFPSVDKALVVAIFPSVDKALVVAIFPLIGEHCWESEGVQLLSRLAVFSLEGFGHLPVLEGECFRFLDFRLKTFIPLSLPWEHVFACASSV